MRLIDMHCDTIWMLMREKDTNLKNNRFCVDVEKLKRAGAKCCMWWDDLSGH